jgi:hypothetical protein
VRRLARAATAALVAGCTPPQGFLPGPTLPWWLVFVIIGGFVLYVYLRRGR